VIGTVVACGGPSADQEVLDARDPLHLEEHLREAVFEGPEVATELPPPVEWRLERDSSDWRPVGYPEARTGLPEISRREDAVRVGLRTAENPQGWRLPHGGIYIDLPGWNQEDWSYLMLEARASEGIDHLELGFNIEAQTRPGELPRPFERYGGEFAAITDEQLHTYQMRADRSYDYQGRLQGGWRQLGIYAGGEEGSWVEIVSVTVIPKEAEYADASLGVRTAIRGGRHRRALFMRSPSRLEYRVDLPEGARLDLGLGVLGGDSPVGFRVAVEPDGGQETLLLEEAYDDTTAWGQRTVDLSPFGGSTATLALEAHSERPGAIALWSAPTLTGTGPAARPNVIFYVIDGGGADFMSVYGYNRRTTPNLERLAAQGVAFERAFSNATWTKPSTASFMTSLHHSVLGGFLHESDRIPDGTETMAEHFHRAGYQTAVFAANPFAGTLTGLERGVDEMRDFGVERNSISSQDLQQDFWRWRSEYPGGPYWVHFQTTDVHWRHRPEPPFAGLFVNSAQRELYKGWDERLAAVGSRNGYSESYEKAGIDRVAYAEIQRGLYDECMAHNDYQIGRLVEELELRGEWENTLLVVAADHGYPAGSWRVLDPLPPKWGPNFNSHLSRVPLIFVWPGQIASGQRFSRPVSMIDVLPTVLELVGLPLPELFQGSSLAELLRGERSRRPGPVVLDEFEVDAETGELRGYLEVVDGRWGASLEINPEPPEEETPEEDRRPVPLLLYDLRRDPFALRHLNEEQAAEVAIYQRMLEKRWVEHRELAKRYSRGGQSAMTEEQLRTLRDLGYIQ
jgi:arylsulfatase A-like enzyme